MKNQEQVLRSEEKAIYRLRALYKNYGYSHYKMSKFEEYDLYAHHKAFLVSDSILTFTDTNGKLMALKPDVTLSIAKHVSADAAGINKVYYNESVYRASASGNGFREIMQTGLECVGHLDLYAQGEVVMLAIRSLELISSDYLMDISHMGLLESLLEETGVEASIRTAFVELIGSKNLPGIRSLCDNLGIETSACEMLCAVTAMYLPLKDAIARIEELAIGERAKAALGELKQLSHMMREYGLDEHLYFDFSIMSDTSYYDGVVFKGFVNGIPESLLSGGRYDRLLTRLGKTELSGAIGFAVYLDRLERFGDQENPYDADVLLIYDKDVEPNDVIKAVRSFTQNGESVRTATALDRGVRVRRFVKLGKGGMETLETND